VRFLGLFFVKTFFSKSAGFKKLLIKAMKLKKSNFSYAPCIEKSNQKCTLQLRPKPIGQLTKLILSQPFAKNWFFRAPDHSDLDGRFEEGLQNISYQRQSRDLAFMAPQNF
jgi:hypothetical protein